MVRIWQINSLYHTNVNNYITSSSVDTLITLAGKVAQDPHINWKNIGTVRTRTTVSFVSRRTIQVDKDQQSPNITQSGIYVSNVMEPVKIHVALAQI